jgi:hypothetical protein
MIRIRQDELPGKRNETIYKEKAMVRIPHYGICASKVSRESRGTGAIALYLCYTL